MKKTKKGFTLVELLVVIAILAILATVSIIGYTSFIARANQSNVLTEAKQVYDILYAYDIEDGKLDGKYKGGDDVKAVFTGTNSCEQLPENGSIVEYKIGSDDKLESFKYKNGTITWSFDGTKWSVQ